MELTEGELRADWDNLQLPAVFNGQDENYRFFLLQCDWLQENKNCFGLINNGLNDPDSDSETESEDDGSVVEEWVTDGGYDDKGSKQKYWMADGSGTVRICWAWENEVDYTEGRCLNDGCSCEWGGFKELVDDLIDTDPLYD